MKYFVRLDDERRRCTLVLIDQKRDRFFEASWTWAECLRADDFAYDRARRWPIVERDFWAAINVQSPDTLAEAHELGFVNAFEVHAFAVREGLFSGSA